MIPSEASQSPLGDDKVQEPTPVVTFAWDTATMALSRYRSKFFLVYADGNNLLEPGRRLHSSLNAVSWHSNRHSKMGPKVASFWLNCSRGNGDVDDPTGVFYQLFHADPPLVRRTGRKRKEFSANDGVTTVDSYECEVLVPEEGLIRQCYYCLSWEDNVRSRHSQTRHDKYWCLKVRVSSGSARLCLLLTERHEKQCKKKGRFLSSIIPKDSFGIRLIGDSRHIDRDSIYAE